MAFSKPTFHAAKIFYCDPIKRHARILFMRLVLIMITLLGLAACAGKPSLDDSPLGGPKLDLEAYFQGELRAYGQFQDIFGTVRTRFVVDLVGEWDGETLTLTEDFVYSDNTTEQRIWSLKKTGDDSWEGTAPGVVGTARGLEKDDTFNWAYEINLPVTDGTMKVAFDDWMWRLDDKRVLNRAYMKRFGIPIGEVIIFFEKL